MKTQRSTSPALGWRPSRVGRAFLAVALAVPLLVGVRAEADDLSSDDVAAEILRLEGIADATAQQWTEAQQRAEDLAIEIAEAEAAVTAAEAELTSIQDQMATIAIRRFTEAGTGSQLFFVEDPSVGLQESSLRSVALDAGAGDVDRVDAVQRDLAADRDRVDALREENERVIATLEASQASLDDQLAQLQVLYEQLKDEEIRRAYEAQLAAQRAAQERAEAE
ncbi:MAG: hypothetical protein F2534_13625, partial [Actinobacteria bacterium]|nr:hypothetical protein [Actinomycetota bacterium]